MCKALKDALPIGTRWSAYNHARNLDMGERTVKAHRRDEIVFVNHARMDTDAGLTMPKANRVSFPGPDTVVILDYDADLPLITYRRIAA